MFTQRAEPASLLVITHIFLGVLFKLLNFRLLLF